VFVAVKDEMLPVPLAANPMEELLFVQLKIVPVTTPPKLTEEITPPLHTT
jgi:hypothetical protein